MATNFGELISYLEVVHSGDSFRHTLNADRINAIQECIKALIRCENIDTPLGGGIRKVAGATGALLSVAQQARSAPTGGSANLAPFDAVITGADPADPSLLTVTFQPGTANSLLPTYLFDGGDFHEFSATTDDRWYAKLTCTSDGEKITGCSLALDTSSPPLQSPNSFALPTTVTILLGIINNGTWYRCIGKGSLVLVGNQDFIVEKDPPADPGELTYVPYFSWKWWTDAKVEPL